MGNTVIFIHYQLNKQYYTKVLCENKDKPMMHCNGQCHLAKELKEAEQKTNLPFNSVKSENETTLYSQTDFASQFAIAEKQVTHFTLYSMPFSSKHLCSVFHPPQA